ncbi:MAG: LamG domain-containing protein, partial [Candidatus Paceibacterota bacterium]
EALDLANAALSDTKYATGLTRIDMPYLHNMDIFSGIIIHHPKLSSTIDFYGVQSISHELDWTNSQQKFRTYITGIGQVVGKSVGWQHKMSRPGANPPQEGLNIRPETINNDRLDNDLNTKLFNVPARQTILKSGPSIYAGTGLNVNISASSIYPFLLTFSGGYGANGTIDYVSEIKESITSAWILPPNSYSFLFIEHDPLTKSNIYNYSLTFPEISESYNWEKGDSLIHFEGPNGNTNISCEYGHSVMCYGNAQISTAQSKFGTSSLVCDGTNDYVEIDSIAFFNPYSFTMECWIRWTTLPASGANSLVFGSTNHYSFWLALNNTGGTRKLSLSLSSNGSSYDIASASLGTKTDWLADTWYHIALIYDEINSNFNVYVDGNLDKTISSSLPIYSLVGGIRLGADWNIASDFTGYIDEFRYTSKSTRYINAFIPSDSVFSPDTYWYDLSNEIFKFGGPNSWIEKIMLFVGEAVTNDYATVSVFENEKLNKGITNDTLTVAFSKVRIFHRLYRIPKYSFSMLCFYPDLGYSVGEEVSFFPNYYYPSDYRTHGISADLRGFNILLGGSSQFRIINKTTLLPELPTADCWYLRIKYWI